MSAVLAERPALAPRAGQFDAIVVGSGPGGATVARDLARQGKKVLLLERGGDMRPRDGLIHLAAVGDFQPVADKVGVARALTTGGTTAIYFGVAEFPPMQLFRDLGIDLSGALAEARSELPLTEPLSDKLLGTQVRKVAASAAELGVPWVKTASMMIDETMVKGAYTHEAVWRARSWVDQAVAFGATLITRATVQRVLVAGGRAVGVQYELKQGRKRSMHQVFGTRVIVCAGALATPQILRASGLASVGSRGFYCDPAFFVMAHVDGLKGRDLFPGCMGTASEAEGILVGDGCMPRALYRGQMLGGLKVRDFFRHGSHIGVGVMVRDGLGGSLREDGRLHKEFTREELQKLDKGAELAGRIVAQAGGRNVVRTELSAAHVGGLLQFGEHVNASLETEVDNLHVCDSSLLPANVRLTPVFTLVCLGKYLAKRLAPLL